MDTSYLTQQVTSIIGQLHNLFDEIGVPHHERDSRESELFSSLSETLHNHLRAVSKEKNELIDEGQNIITTIRQMEASLDDPRPNSHYPSKHTRDAEELSVTYPLLDSLQILREKQRTVGKLHEERYEQVKKLVQALQSYSAHLEPSFVQIKLPPVSPDAIISPSFDLSPSYITKVDHEFTRVYEEYMKRVALVQQLAQQIVNFWAELGTPQAQTDSAVVSNWKDSPEQLGLHQADIDRLQSRHDSLREEKSARERKLNKLRVEIEGLWERLNIEDRERKAFLARTRGCGLRAINDMEAELTRLNELKRQNLGLFVEDARQKLTALWDELYISEEEAVEFTPMFCDVYSDALLSAHEQEISRLETLKEQRAPVLSLISKHRSLIKDREDLAASSQDASRLMAKGAKGERRDPTRLLREEKMRKRIARDLPKVEAEISKILSAWEEEYGRDFLVFGERYLDVVESALVRVAPPRSKTPNNFAASTATKSAKAASQMQRPNTAASHREQPPLRSKTPVSTATLGRYANPPSLKSTSNLAPASKSPSRIPARAPLASRPDGGNSPERRGPVNASSKGFDGNATVRGGATSNLMAPPPKMRDLNRVQNGPPHAHAGSSTPSMNHNAAPSDILRSGSVVRSVIPEDPYVLSSNGRQASTQPPVANHYREMPPPPRPAYRHEYADTNSTVGSVRTISAASSVNSSGSGSQTAPSSVAASGSENWETFGSDDDEDEPVNAYSSHHGKKRPFQHGGRFDGYPVENGTVRGGGGGGGGSVVYGQGAVSGANKKPKAGAGAGVGMTAVVDENGRERILSCSESGWTDDDGGGGGGGVMGETF